MKKRKQKKTKNFINIGLAVGMIAIAVILFFKGMHYQPAAVNYTAQTTSYPQTIGPCRFCMPLAGSGIPYDKDIGEYVDAGLYAKLLKLASVNNTWRITEAWPPTVKHLSFCHFVGTCVDIGLYHDRLSAKYLNQLCDDLLANGFSFINEYSGINLNYNTSSCPNSQIFETTTGGNLHIW